MKTMITLPVLAAVASMSLAPSISASAQEEAAAETESIWGFSAGADLVSSYVWRGTHCGGISFQPSLGLSCGPVTLGAWGSTDFDNLVNEFDLSLTFEMAGFSLALTDYFFPENGVDLIGEGRRGGYFEWDKDETGHQLEVTVSYDFSEKTNLPLTFLWGTMVGGADLDDEGDRLFSSYFEIGYTHTVKDVDVALAAGFTPFESMYEIGDGFNMVNFSVTGSYEIKFTDSFSLPVFAQAVLNPNTENVYLVVGFSF